MSTSTITSPIPSDLSAIPGIARGFRPSTVNHGRYVFAGRGGVGKSTLIHSNPKAFILDPEGGGSTAADPQALTYQVPRNILPGQIAATYIKVAEQVIRRAAQGKTDYELFCMDTMDELIDIFLSDFCLNHKIDDPLEYKDGNGNGYSIVRQQLFGLLDKAYRAGMGWAVLSHIEPKTKKVGGTERTLLSLSMSDSFRRALIRKCEHMMFIEYKNTSVMGASTFKQVGGELDEKGEIVGGKRIEIAGTAEVKVVRVLRTRPGGVWQGESAGDVKVRLPYPEETEIPPTGGWQALADVHEEAVKTLKKETPSE